MPTKVIDLLQADLTAAESEAYDSKLIGKRVDTAHADLREWTKTLAQRETTLRKAQGKVEEAKGEVRRAHQELTKLMTEAAQEESVRKRAGSGIDCAVVADLACLLARSPDRCCSVALAPCHLWRKCLTSCPATSVRGCRGSAEDATDDRRDCEEGRGGRAHEHQP